MKVCIVCEKTIEGKWIRADRKFCGEICSKKYKQKVYRSLNPPLNLTTGMVGCLHELEVTCDLIKRGFHVYRAVSGNSDCNLAIVKDNKLIRVEVTTGRYEPKEGKYFYPHHDESKYDLLAIIFYDGKIIYKPEI